MCPRRGRNGWAVPFRSELISQKICLITDLVDKNYQVRAGGQKKRALVLQTSQRIGQTDGRTEKRYDHVLPNPFTQRLNSMLRPVTVCTWSETTSLLYAYARSSLHHRPATHTRWQRHPNLKRFNYSETHATISI